MRTLVLVRGGCFSGSDLWLWFQRIVASPPLMAELLGFNIFHPPYRFGFGLVWMS